MHLLVAIALFGACGIVLLSTLFDLCSRTARWGTGLRLAAAHSLVIFGFLVVAPIYIYLTWDSPYGDVYGPYLLVPGIHIYYPVNLLFGGPVFHWLLGHTESFPASVLCVIVGPGLGALVIGGVQWWLVGTLWDRLTRLRRRTAVE